MTPRLPTGEMEVKVKDEKLWGRCMEGLGNFLI